MPNRHGVGAFTTEFVHSFIGARGRAVKNVFPFFRHPTTDRFLRFIRRDIRRAWPAALNARDTETTPVVYIRVLIHDTSTTHDDTHDPSAHIHDNATAAGYLV